jgi:hypothetical protein
MGLYDRSYGSKYHTLPKYAPSRDIAKLIRADIKAAVAEGKLPKAKYSVTTESYSGGSSINIRIQDLPGAWVPLTEQERVEQEARYGYIGHETKLSPEAAAALKIVEGFHWDYNYNGSNSQIDYFDVNYYGHAEVESEWHSEFRAEEKAKAEAKKAAAAVAPAPAPYVSPRVLKCDKDGYFPTGEGRYRHRCGEVATVIQKSKSRHVLDHPRCEAHARGSVRPIVVQEGTSA